MSEGEIKTEWLRELGLTRTICTLHGAAAVHEAYHSYSTTAHMPLHVDRCSICGAESKPMIHADLGL